MNETPAFIQGVFHYRGAGLEKPLPLEPPAQYATPPDKRAQTIYFRAGNPLDDLIYLVLKRNGKAMRYFPVGAKAAIHVPLAVVEDLSPDDRIELEAAAPAGSAGSVVLDIGFLEIP